MLHQIEHSTLHGRIEYLRALRWNEALVRDENPIAAADPDTARIIGGPLTQRVLDNLPPDFLSARLVVDSHLAWLPEGYSLEPGEWAHEVALNGFEAGLVDATAARVIQVTFSKVTELRLLTGEVATEWLTGGQSSDGRDRSAMLAFAARARAQSLLAPAQSRGELVERVVPSGVPVRYPAFLFRRHSPARSPGFCFTVRIVAHSERPYLNLPRRSASHAQY